MSRTSAHLLLTVSVLFGQACPPGDDVDAGPDCDPPDPCAGQEPTGPVPVLAGGASARLVVGATELLLGQATRLDVQTSLGFGVADNGNDFRQNHCDLGLQLQYVDEVDDDAFGGAPNGDDVLVRVITLPGSQASASGLDADLHGGEPLDAARALFGTAVVDVSREGYTQLLDGGLGIGALATGDAVTQLSLFSPTAVEAFTLPFVLDTGELGEGADRLLTRETTFAEADDVLGAPAAEGVAAGDFLLVDARVGTWPSLGVRAAGICPALGVCDGDTRLSSILLSSPFMGEGEAGLGLFSTKDTVDAHFSSSGTDVDGVIVYSGMREIGFLYQDAPDCSERVVGIILDHRVAP